VLVRISFHKRESPPRIAERCRESTPCRASKIVAVAVIGKQPPAVFIQARDMQTPYVFDIRGGRSSAISRRMSAHRFLGMATSAIWKATYRLSDWPGTNPHEIEDRLRHGFATHLIVARFLQKFSRLSVPPKSVVKLVESTKTISPARCSFGAIQRRQLNSVLPAAVNGCGRSRSIG
jgi:hypothetical protein